ncbi:putative mannose-6-phosphate isomerase GmuF [Caprobacter fermentans]|uniref:Phosphohexomutase n=1 Tax=Caproicibacter fermentans TaxID=2576756 RepID=A0A6N8I3B1_9FIRM|nr:type I phosphomannose isomerase catalytic subunit [Caproicibacter fermentans]MVB12227.1 putative mannose-6-phosphate isomerase GmuF [Caproicibacter fermentans]OCN01122.1 mannose-6-phosphate isomerase [Clostridium sp. W14A]
MEQLYPIRLNAVCKDYIWGGTRLRTEYHQQSSAAKVAESWVLSCHPDGPAVIANGECRDLTLNEYFKMAGRRVLGSDCEKFPDFPVLIKLIDAKDALSIQVHPDNEYARAHGGGFGKTEMWYIVDCEEGAYLYYGFDHEISKEEFRERIENNTLTEVLNKVTVHPGDVLMIESGTLHAIGAGILIAEIQQNSNLTYRIYDYGRPGADGKPRELHIPQALDVTRRSRPARPVGPQGDEIREPGCVKTLLGSCEYFTVNRMKITEHALCASEKSFQSILCLSGDALILDRGRTLLTFAKGDSIFLPAGFGRYTVKGDCEILLTEV